MIYKTKGDRAICGNSYDIFLLSVAGKLLARVMLIRLWHSSLTQWFRNLSVAFIARGALLIWFSLYGFSKTSVGDNIVTFQLPSSTLQRHLTPSIVICCGEFLENLGVLRIFSASYGNSILVWVSASCREERCWRVLVRAHLLSRAAPSICYHLLFSISSLWQRLSSSVTTSLLQTAF